MDAFRRQPEGGYDGPDPWDEHRWEAYIRRQDARADEYAALVDYYGDQPDAHNLIARLMGWTHLLTNCRGEPTPRRCAACPRGLRSTCRFHEAYFGRGYAPPVRLGGVPDPLASIEEQATHAEWNIRYAQHSIHRHARELVSRLNALCESLPPGSPPLLPLRQLLHVAQQSVAKISAALSDYTCAPMLGLVIAYLKMAHRTICLALGQLAPCHACGSLPEDEAGALGRLLLILRGQLSELIDEFRARLAAVRGKRDA